jgi:predicted nucleic acid-binding protein
MPTHVMLDTSIWTRALRRVGGDPVVRSRVERLIAASEAAWCDIVLLELWAGVRDDVERRHLTKLSAAVRRLPITDEVWSLAFRVADVGRSSGVTAPANDILIFACARHHGATLEHRDDHFVRLAALPL